MISIESIVLPVPGLEDLHAEARAEGYSFVSTLVEEWASGKNHFDAPGEALCGHFAEGRLVAIGGLNCDPFVQDPQVGRIRRVYVRAAWRNQGVGRALVLALLDRARGQFRSVRLRAVNTHAAGLYERIGFLPLAASGATHIFHFEPGPQ